jgi:hypothetical protein
LEEIGHLIVRYREGLHRIYMYICTAILKYLRSLNSWFIHLYFFRVAFVTYVKGFCLHPKVMNWASHWLCCNLLLLGLSSLKRFTTFSKLKSIMMGTVRTLYTIHVLCLFKSFKKFTSFQRIIEIFLFTTYHLIRRRLILRAFTSDASIMKWFHPRL